MIDGFWLPQDVRERVLSSETTYATLSFAQGRPCAAGAEGAVTARWPQMQQAQWVALLDSLHTKKHVWAEFQLATQLVCPGGLILIHDAALEYGSVEGALQQIEQAGYGVTRLWTAECGVSEDDHLGLAVIENRLRSCAEIANESL